MTRALAGRAGEAEKAKKFSLLSNALISRGSGDGWGSTNANASAILALSEMLGKGRMEATRGVVDGFVARGLRRALHLGAGSPTAFWQSTDGGPVSLTLVSTAPAPEAQGSGRGCARRVELPAGGARLAGGAAARRLRGDARATRLPRWVPLRARRRSASVWMRRAVRSRSPWARWWRSTCRW